MDDDYDDYVNILPDYIAKTIYHDESMSDGEVEVEVCSFEEVDGKIIAKYELYGVIEGEYTVEGTLQMIDGDAVFVADEIYSQLNNSLKGKGEVGLVKNAIGI